jgi:hypothetical protein
MVGERSVEGMEVEAEQVRTGSGDTRRVVELGLEER